jgi:hypothetical protein
MVDAPVVWPRSSPQRLAARKWNSMQRSGVGALPGMTGLIRRGVMGGVLLTLTGGLSAAFGSGGQPASAVAPRSVVVVLRDQFHGTPDTARHAAARSADVAGAQATLLHSVAANGGTVTRRFHLLDAFAATVSPTEQAALARNPAVSAVYPNQTFRITEPQQVSSPAVLGNDAAAAPFAAAAPLVAPQTGSTAVCGTLANPLLDPDALQITHTAPSTLNGSTAGTEQSTGITGSGVTVGLIADGLDPTDPDLMRGGHSIVDQVDFSGDGVDAPSSGGEAFGDATAIAAQGVTPYDLSQRIAANPQIGSGCDIRIRGVAPGANLLALKAFGAGGFTTTEDLVAAIDYAVTTKHVNVLNESFGGGPIPDDAQDAVRQADEQAYAAGVTVVSSTGDSGPFDEQESPSSDPDVISAAGSMSNRVDAQLGNYGAGLKALGEGFEGGTTAAPAGWLDNNPAAFSASGIDEAGGVPDLIAPSDEWSLCSPTQMLFPDCFGTTETEFVGTSVSSPVTAGAAALVIEAYANSHGGSDPSPALVKQILMSTADDTGAPSQEQGAGLLDTFAAVRAAESKFVGVGGTVTAPAPTGVLVSTSSNVASPDGSGPGPGQIDLSGPAGTSTSATIDVTNTGSSSETITPALRALTSSSQTSGHVTLDGPGGAQTFQFGDGSTHSDQSWTFTVPSGTGELREQASWVGQQSNVQMSLFDPSGRYEGTTNLSNEGVLDVAEPQTGTWTALAFTGTDASSYDGPVDHTTTLSNFTSPAAVSPASLTLAPGAQGSFTVPVTFPAGAGDENEDVALSTALTSAKGTVLSTDVVPVALRALAALSGGAPGTFSGTAEGDGATNVGGNGFATYNFDVPAGAPALTADVTLPGDTTTPMSGFLIDPQGEPLSISDNAITDANGNDTGLSSTVQDVVLAPQAGRWRYVVGVTVPAGGSEDAGTYHGTVTLSSPDTVTAANVPDSADTFVAPGATTQATIDVVNGGTTDQLVFADPRSRSLAQIPLAADYATGDSVPLPFTDADSPVQFLVPPDTTALTASSQALDTGGQPLAGAAFDLSAFDGDPDVASTVGNKPSGTATATLGVNPTLAQVAQGTWLLTPSLDGPFDLGADVPTGTATASVLADTLGFDTSVTGSTGDYWLQSTNPSASAAGLSLASGAGGQIHVSFAPSASTPVGTVVSGTVYIDDHFNGTGSGDQLAAVPYTYTVGTAPPATTTPPLTTTPTPPGPGLTVTPAPAPPEPTARIATGVRATAKKLSTRIAALRLPLNATCASSAHSRCRVSVTATVPGALAGSRARTVTIGSGSLTVAAGQSAIAHLKLTARGIKLLRARHALTVTLHVDIRTPGSAAFAHSITLRLTYAHTKRAAANR